MQWFEPVTQRGETVCSRHSGAAFRVHSINGLLWASEWVAEIWDVLGGVQRDLRGYDLTAHVKSGCGGLCHSSPAPTVSGGDGGRVDRLSFLHAWGAGVKSQRAKATQFVDPMSLGAL